MNKQELNRFIDKISPTGPGGIEKIKKVLKLVLDKESEGKEGEEDITETSYSDLKTLRDNGQLIPGHLYRITDYVTTTAQEGTTSAMHRFDIIVQAITESVLSEDAKAIQHKFEWPEQCWCDDDSDIVELAGVVIINNKECVVYKDAADYCYAISKNSPEFAALDEIGDFNYCFTTNYVSEDMESWTEENSIWLRFKQDLREFSYFSNSNLAAWKLKYCLDNDTDRFAWAQSAVVDGINTMIVEDGKSYESGVYGILKRCPSFDGSQEGEYNYAWGTDADVELGDNTNFMYSKNPIVQPGEQVYNANESKYQNVIKSFSGKGVIYQMIDEHNNNCPYDFKNILFSRKQTDYSDWFTGMFGQDFNSSEAYFYTFSWINENFSIDDTSVVGKLDDGGMLQYARNNTIKSSSRDSRKNELLILNNIILVSSWHFDDTIYYGTKNNMFSYKSNDCTLGGIFHDNVFDNYFNQNVLLGTIEKNKSFGIVTGFEYNEEIINKIIYNSTGDTIEMKDINDAFSET